jgi:hypothetical protein
MVKRSIAIANMTVLVAKMATLQGFSLWWPISMRRLLLSLSFN